MRKVMSIPVVALTVLLAALPAAAQVGGKDQRILTEKGTWTGRLVDSGCYKKFGAAAAEGADHLQCTIDAMKKGDPTTYLAVLTDGDGIFKVVGEMTKANFAKLRDYVGKNIEVTGVSSLPIGGWATREIDIEKVQVAK